MLGKKFRRRPVGDRPRRTGGRTAILRGTRNDRIRLPRKERVDSHLSRQQIQRIGPCGLPFARGGKPIRHLLRGGGLREGDSSLPYFRLPARTRTPAGRQPHQGGRPGQCDSGGREGGFRCGTRTPRTGFRQKGHPHHGRIRQQPAAPLHQRNSTTQTARRTGRPGTARHANKGPHPANRPGHFVNTETARALKRNIKRDANRPSFVYDPTPNRSTTSTVFGAPCPTARRSCSWTGYST